MASTFKCLACGRGFKEDDRVIPVSRYVENYKRGDFVTQANEYVHLSHVSDGQWWPARKEGR